MRTEGFLAPDSERDARETFAHLEPPAAEVARAVAMALGVDGEDYRERVDDEVVYTTREALFGSLLLVRTADHDTFEEWIDRPAYREFERTVEGGEHVDNVAWHVAPLADRVFAATYANERTAAISTLRRLAWGRIYRELLLDGGAAD